MKTSVYGEYIAEQLSAWGDIVIKGMFGGFGVYRDGLMFALIADDQLYFKVDDSNRRDFEQAGSVKFTYEAKGETMALSYWLVPAEVIDDRDEISRWAEKAYEVAVNAKNSKRKKAG